MGFEVQVAVILTCVANTDHPIVRNAAWAIWRNRELGGGWGAQIRTLGSASCVLINWSPGEVAATKPPEQ